MVGPALDAVSWLGIAALMLLIGSLIRFREWTFLVAGYDSSTGVPQRVAANVVGNMLLRIGLAAVAIGLVTVFADVSALAYLFALLVVLDLARVLYRLDTYDETRSQPH